MRLKNKTFKAALYLFLISIILCFTFGLHLILAQKSALADETVYHIPNPYSWETVIGYSTRNKRVCIQLDDDWEVSESITVPANANVKLNLNGNTITGGSGSVFIVDGKLEIEDTSYPQTGKITSGSGSLNEDTGNLYGGGVLVNLTGEFTLSGGSITENDAEYGGGVYVDGGKFVMCGGTISGNTATYGDGVYTTDGLYLSGAVEIDDLYLPDSSIITVTGSLEGSQIGITLDGYTQSFTENYAEYNSFNNPSEYFTCIDKLVVIDGNLEVCIAEQNVVWSVKVGDGEYEEIEDAFGISVQYGIPVSITADGTEVQPERYDAGRQTLTYNDYGFLLEITPAPISASLVEDGNIKFDGNKYTVNYNSELFENEYATYTPSVSVTSGNSIQLEEEIDYTIQVNYKEGYIGEATVKVTGEGNYSGEVILTFYIIDPTGTEITVVDVEWQYYDISNDVWGNAANFTYTGEDLSQHVRAEISYTQQGEPFTDYAYFGGNVWDIAFINGSNEEVTFKNAGEYTVTLTSDDGSVFSETVDINRANVNLNTANLSQNGAWKLYVGDLADNTAIDLLGEDNGAYAYYRKSGGISTTLTLVLNTEFAGLSDINELEGVTVSYTGNGSTGSENEEKVTVNTTATITFANHTVNGGNDNSVTVEKIWDIITASNELWTFYDSNDYTYEQVTENASYEWSFGDSAENGKIFPYTFRPAHGDYAYYTLSPLTGGGAQRFAVRFTDNVMSFWQLSEANEVGDRIRDKLYLYEFLEELEAGEYTLEVRVPQVIAESVHRKWWLDNSEASDLGTVYAPLSFEFTFNVGKFALPSKLDRETVQNEYVYSGGGLTVSYLSRIAYDAAKPLPTVTVKLNGKQLSSSNDYEITLGNGNTFTLTARPNGNLAGSISNFQFDVASGNNSFDEFSIIAWKHLAFDPNINFITVKPVAGTVTLNIYANNSTVTEDGVVVDRIDLDSSVVTFGVVAPNADGVVNLSDKIVEELTNLPAATYWLRAVAEDENGIYNTIDRQVKFIIFPAENSWAVIPGVVNWRYGEYDEEVNIISGTPAYGSAVYSIYQRSENVYKLLEFGGIASFEITDGKLPTEVSGVLKNLDAGTYYLCARVAATGNYTGFNDKDSFTPEEIRSFPSFTVFNLSNSWSVLPNAVSWKYGGYDPEVNVITGTPVYGENAVFSIYKVNNDNTYQLLDYGEGVTTFELTEGRVSEEVAEKLALLEAGQYFLRAFVAGTENYTGLHEDDSDITKFTAFTVYKFENYWSDTPNILDWKWNEYDPSVNVILASSVSTAPVVFSISYLENNVRKFLKVGDDEKFTVESDDLKSVLEGLHAGTYTLHASVGETANYTGLKEVTSTFSVLRQTNDWRILPSMPSWRYGEYNGEVNVISAEPVFGEAVITVYSEKDGGYEPVDMNNFGSLDSGIYYIRATVAGTSDYGGLNERVDNISHLPSFSVISVNNYWHNTPNVVSWKYGEYDGKVNVISAKPAFGDKVIFTVYALKEGGYSPLSFGGETEFELIDGQVPEEVGSVLKDLDAGTYYLRASVGGSANYTGINEQVEDVTTLTAFSVLKATNYWNITPNAVSWRYGEYNAEVNVFSALPAYGEAQFTVYSFKDGEYATVDLNTINIADLNAGTYYLRATVAETANYTGINEQVSDISKLTSFSVIKVQNHWEDVPAVLGWSEGHYNSATNALVGSARHGEVAFTVTDENGREVDLNMLDMLDVGSYVLHAYVEGTDNYSELSATTTFAVFEDSVGMGRIITATVVFAVFAVALAVAGVILLIRRNKKIEKEFLKMVKSELKNQ